MSSAGQWQQKIGNQRDWVWRGWQIRYTYLRNHSSDRPSSTPLMLLHGFGASIGHWRHNLPVLSQKHTVYALDLLGFGASKKAVANYQIDLWVEQIHDFWQTFIRQPVILVGNSLGSLVCLGAAAKYPDMVQGITMLNLPDLSIKQEKIPQWLLPVATAMEGTVLKIILASPSLFKALFKLIINPRFLRFGVRMAYASEEKITDELLEIIANPTLDEGAINTLYALCQSRTNPAFAPAAKQILPTLNIPILLVWGSLDRLVPPALAPIFAALNSQIQLVELENVGHCPHDESPDRFHQIFLDWLERNFGQTTILTPNPFPAGKGSLEEEDNKQQTTNLGFLKF